jgi:hypothetical protein
MAMRLAPAAAVELELFSQIATGSETAAKIAAEVATSEQERDGCSTLSPRWAT